jgi:hypothetical protein
MGFDGMFFGRDDYQDYEQRNRTKNMEMVWKASANLGKEQTVMSGLNRSILKTTHLIRSTKLVIYGYFTEWLCSTKHVLF